MNGSNRKRARGPEGDTFRWPSRALADRSERAAARAAQEGLERLRARAAKLRSGPKPVPRADPVDWLVPRGDEELAGPNGAGASDESEEPVAATEVVEAIKPEADDGLEALEPEADALEAPELWSARFDELTEDLVEDLQRDLGPAQA